MSIQCTQVTCEVKCFRGQFGVFLIFKNLVPRTRQVLEWKIHLDLYVIQFYVVTVFHLVKQSTKPLGFLLIFFWVVLTNYNFCCNGQLIPRYGRIFKIAIFGQETWPLDKVPEVAHLLFFHTIPKGVEIELIFALRTAVSEIWADFQNCHIWAWDLVTDKKFRSWIYILSFYHGVEIELTFHSTGSGFRDTGNFLKLPYLDMKPGKWPNFRTWACALFLPQGGLNWANLCSTGSGFWHTGHFSKLPYLGMALCNWPKFQELYILSLSTSGGWNRSYFLLYEQQFLRYGPFFKN